jgi:hypothetical protein
MMSAGLGGVVQAEAVYTDWYSACINRTEQLKLIES